MMRFWHSLCWVMAIAGGFAVAYLESKRGEANSIIAPWMVFLVVTAVVAFLVGAAFTSRIDCPECKGYSGHAYQGDLISSKPLHERADGQPDRRYKHNPTMNSYEKKGRCSKCGHVWHRGTHVTTL